MSAPAETAPAAAQAAPKKSKKLLVIIVAVVLLAGGGGGAFFYLQKTGAEAAEKPEKGKKAKAEKDDEESGEEAEESENEAEEPADAKHAGNHGAKGSKTVSMKSALPDDEDVKHVIELQPFIVNLTDTDETRYLRLTVSVGIGGEEGGEEAKPDAIFTARVRNALLAVLTTKSSTDVLTTEGKAALRKELLKAARAASEEPMVEAIYITEFIVQL